MVLELALKRDSCHEVLMSLRFGSALDIQISASNEIGQAHPGLRKSLELEGPLESLSLAGKRPAPTRG